MPAPLPNAELRAAATDVVRRLVDAGFRAYFVGGCVRDRLLPDASPPSEYDIATDARPAAVEACFDRTHAIGRVFGVVQVLHRGGAFEVATFRTDGAYTDGRHPDAVAFSTPEVDARRRDFTINALYEDPLSGAVLDFVGGRDDLAAGVIRAIGDPSARFTEDKLRLLRAVRFAARFGFAIEPETAAAVHKLAPALEVVSAERVRDELTKLWLGPAPGRALGLLDELGLLGVALPELALLDAGALAVTRKALGRLARQAPGSDAPPRAPRAAPWPAAQRAHVAWALAFHALAPSALASSDAAAWLGTIAAPRQAAATPPAAYAALEASVRGAMQRLKQPRAAEHAVTDAVLGWALFDAAVASPPHVWKRLARHPHVGAMLDVAREALAARGADAAAVERFVAQSTNAHADGSLRPKPLLDGHEVRALGCEGPAIQRVLLALEDAQLDGTVTTRDAAAALARSLAPEGRSGGHA